MFVSIFLIGLPIQDSITLLKFQSQLELQKQILHSTNLSQVIFNKKIDGKAYA